MSGDGQDGHPPLSSHFEVVEAWKIPFFDGPQDRRRMIDAVIGLEMIVVVELGGPRICRVYPADCIGVIPIFFSHTMPIAPAVDDYEVAACRIVNLDIGTATESGNGGKGRKGVTELLVGHGDDGSCGLGGSHLVFGFAVGFS